MRMEARTVVAAISLVSLVAGIGCAGRTTVSPQGQDAGTNDGLVAGDAATNADVRPTGDGSTLADRAVSADGAVCTSNCVGQGSVKCSVDNASVLVCTNEGTVTDPCLQWSADHDCAVDERCNNGACAQGGCCTADGIDCCLTGSYPTGSDCSETTQTDGCRVRERLRNGSELCDDAPATMLDPVNNRYFLLCFNNGGHDKGEKAIGYVSTNSGPPCPLYPGTLAHCQCWEQTGVAPWTQLAYVPGAKLECTTAGDRLEVFLPAAGKYNWGVYPAPELVGSSALVGYCPGGKGCMAAVGLLEIPK